MTQASCYMQIRSPGCTLNHVHIRTDNHGQEVYCKLYAKSPITLAIVSGGRLHQLNDWAHQGM